MQSAQIRTTLFEKLIENGFSTNAAEISTLGAILLAYILITIILFWVSRKIVIGFFTRISKRTKSTLDDLSLIHI